MHFDLVDVRLLVAIASTGSLSKAAATFPVAVSAASTRLRQFEERCQVSLFARHANGMTPTPAGRLVLEACQRILNETQRLDDNLQALSGQQRVVLKLCASTVANSTFLPAALGPFLADYPEVDLQLTEGTSRSILRGVQAGEFDLGVYDGNQPTGGLLSLPFRDDRLVLLVPHGHELAGRRLGLAEALGFPYIGLPGERAMQRFIEDKAIAAGIALRVRVRAPSFDAIAQLVAQGAGLAMLPEAAASRLAQELPLTLVDIADSWASRELRLCIRDWQSLPSHARQLVSHLSGVAHPG
ncbi:LysR family transcriptional regulator [Pseudomonas sp. PA27(2017)]|uniref:LysR family transcriptional regulator n=1 Tax=Pseudomonas sp. PA27(2017) TaxID=1932112 RepID=UPI00095F986C|nr:LysR family transcriptional regulator [Pseudomonas sp. PA27(2017)]OLU31565.1 LysR family transcriptional regulator [Pseudomonas sp. PA27(2017)]